MIYAICIKCFNWTWNFTMGPDLGCPLPSSKYTPLPSLDAISASLRIFNFYINTLLFCSIIVLSRDSIKYWCTGVVHCIYIARRVLMYVYRTCVPTNKFSEYIVIAIIRFDSYTVYIVLNTVIYYIIRLAFSIYWHSVNYLFYESIRILWLNQTIA